MRNSGGIKIKNRIETVNKILNNPEGSLFVPCWMLFQFADMLPAQEIEYIYILEIS